MRRSPLGRRSRLRRSRTLSPESERRAAEAEEYAALRATLLPAPCGAGLALAKLGLGFCTREATELHHRRKRSSAGALAHPGNVIPVCHSCNMAIEDYPAEARAAGLVVREGDPEWDRLSARAWRER